MRKICLFLILNLISLTTQTHSKNLNVELKNIENVKPEVKKKQLKLNYFIGDTIEVISYKNPIKEYVHGYDIIGKEDVNDTLLLACYINTQSRGDTTNLSLADKFAIAQVMMNVLARKDSIGQPCTLSERLLTRSSTVKGRSSYAYKSFELIPGEYHSSTAYLAAKTVMAGEDYPEWFDVEDAYYFYNDKITNVTLGERTVRRFRHLYRAIK